MDRLAGVSGFGGVYGTGIVRPQRGSSIVIGYESALAFWRRVRVEDPMWTRELLGQLYPDEMLTTLDAEALAADTSLRPLELPNLAFERARHAAAILGLSMPLTVVVGKRPARRPSSALVCHTWSGPIADGLLVPVEPGVFMCSPELVVMQLAHSLGLYKSIALVMELSGSYSISSNGQCEWDVISLTSVARLNCLVCVSAECRGIRTMRQVGRLAMDNSASPRETALAVMLSLPRDLGGWGCGKPRLNADICLSEEAARECSRPKLIADLLFEDAGLDVEYQGREWHEKSEDRLSDETRQNALMMMGKSCLFISKDQLRDESRMDGIARLIRSKSGLEPFRKELSPKMASRRMQMMADLGVL